MKHICTLSPNSKRGRKTITSNKIAEIKNLIKKFWSDLQTILTRQNKDCDFSNELLSYITKDDEKYPQLKCFVKNQEDFMKKHFSQLTTCVIREKRLLDFETPNRVHVLIEYDISNFSEKKGVFYLFTPSARLNWLKIFINGTRVIIAESSTVKNLIYKILEQEIKNLEKEYGKKNIFDDIWNILNPLPCFVLIDNINCKNLLIEISFYQSVYNVKTMYRGCLNWLDKRIVAYDYYPVTNNTAWLYIKAPQKSDINVIYKDECIQRIYADNQEDTQIVSYMIQGNNKKNHIFNINIDVTKPLKWWFNTLYILIVLIIIAHLFIFLGIMQYIKIYISLDKPLKNDYSLLTSISISLIAMIIATRGWLVNEDSTMKRYSKFLSVSAVLLFLLLLLQLLKI